jgi:HJR/Mrr/RecB family endonuclease
VDWFRFERDVQAAAVGLGFEVVHVAASRAGDQGVDLYASKGLDLDQVAWVIQCKCYGPDHLVGPHVVRELLGALQAHPRGTRGMIVTTSDFTDAAKRLAASNHVRLMNGDEFVKLRGRGTTGAV